MRTDEFYKDLGDLKESWLGKGREPKPVTVKEARDTNVVGDVRFSKDLHDMQEVIFMLELEKLMLRYKVTKVDVALDAFAILEEFAEKMDEEDI